MTEAPSARGVQEAGEAGPGAGETPAPVADRRQAPRHAALHGHGIVSATVRPGHEVLLIDVSAGGALLETGRRLLPGSSIELHLATRERRTLVRGSVLRCAVARLSRNAVCYRGAIGFEGNLPWLIERREEWI
jgi:hypothetical protein